MRYVSVTRTIMAVVVAAALAAGPAAAQDTNYWTNQFGNQARLLGGAVIGSAGDIAAVYYNPGRLALIEGRELVIGGNVLQYTSITVHNALGKGLGVTSSQLAGVPSLFAGEIRAGWLGNHRLGYSFLNRHSLDLRVETRADLTELVDMPIDFLIGSLEFEQKMSDYWAGLTWSYRPQSWLGVGASMFFSVRNQRTRRQMLAQAGSDTSGGLALQKHDFDYAHWGILWKIGIAAQFGDWDLGANVTTPVLRLFGSGRVGFDETVILQNDSSGGSTAIISDLQQDIPTTYHAPAAFGFGIAYDFGATRLHGSGEWFASVDRYTILDTEPIPSPETGDTRDSDVTDEADAVFNFGVGVEHAFNQRVGGYLSFRSDFSAAIPPFETNATVSTWDIYHVAGGATFPVGKIEFTLGTVYAFGNDSRLREIELVPDPDPDDGIVLPEDLETDFRRITFILGFSFVY
jgi:hypothetical protein